MAILALILKGRLLAMTMMIVKDMGIRRIFGWPTSEDPSLVKATSYLGQTQTQRDSWSTSHGAVFRSSRPSFLQNIRWQSLQEQV